MDAQYALFVYHRNKNGEDGHWDFVGFDELLYVSDRKKEMIESHFGEDNCEILQLEMPMPVVAPAEVNWDADFQRMLNNRKFD